MMGSKGGVDRAMVDKTFKPWSGGLPHLLKTFQLPRSLLITRETAFGKASFGGDWRFADFSGGGELGYLVYRSCGGGRAGEGMKPCWMAAVDAQGEVLWEEGCGGEQPARPGPVLIADVDGDGQPEIVCFWSYEQDEGRGMQDVWLQMRDALTGRVKMERQVPELSAMSESENGEANWVHQRLLLANFRGLSRPQDVCVKVGTRILAFDERLELLWTYDNANEAYQNCPAYIPAVGDVDGDGRDEVLGGYYLLNHDGEALWEEKWGRNMDSVCIAPWGGNENLAFCSGEGHVVDAQGDLRCVLGPEWVPHGQELRLGRFLSPDEPSMAIRWNGHEPDLLVLGGIDLSQKISKDQKRTRLEESGNESSKEIIHGAVDLRRWVLSPSHNQTGMETVAWQGEAEVDLLTHGGRLWDLRTGANVALPELPEVPAHGRMSWWHAIPMERSDGRSEDLLLYNPWHDTAFLYSSQEHLPERYLEGQKSCNVRIFD